MSSEEGGEVENLDEFEYEYEYVEEGEGGKYEGVQEEESSLYNSDDFISGAYLSENCSVPENVLEFHHSFAYDCKRYFNLTVVDENILIFASGNLIHFFDTTKKLIWFRRSAFGYGIGHITKNPNMNYHHIAIAENERQPPIIIYEWPSLDIVCLLKGGAERQYVHLNYSPDGELLASQAGEPDYLITIWDWKQHKIKLRTKSYVNDVFNLVFSPSVPGHLTTSGVGHIKFWKMAQTFTGLKLKGENGRFGKTEVSDIVGLYPMPDEKVVSGCEWGNMLIWDEGLISKEVSRKLKKPCHNGAITQFEYIDGELLTISLDGWVRMWYYDTIDLANPPEESRFVETEPSYEFHITTAKGIDTQLMSIVKQNNDPKNSLWYAQDGNGSLLHIDLPTDTDAIPTKQLFQCHAGAISGIAACPWGPHIATLGIDGRLHLYNYLRKELLIIKQFPAKGTAIIWLPVDVDPSGSVIVMGFDDGVIRVVVLSIGEREIADTDNTEEFVTLIQVTKPHTQKITRLSLNESGSILVSGSEDSTIFIYQLSPGDEFVQLVPIGFLNVPNIVTYIYWKPHTSSTIFIGCIHGEVIEADLPENVCSYTNISYQLTHIKYKQITFKTCKSKIRRDIKLKEIEEYKQKKIAKKRKEMDKIKAENPGIVIDEDVFLADSESDEELEPLYIPEVPNPVLFIIYTPIDTLWLSIGGFDAGYIYEYKMNYSDSIRNTMVYDADDIEIRSYLYSPDKLYLIFGMEDGRIRINKINSNNFRDLSNYWMLSMHDNYNGIISNMCFSYDSRHFFSCGSDGNIFSYEYNSEIQDFVTDYTKPIPLEDRPKIVAQDICDYKYLSLEETRKKEEYDSIMKNANIKKEKVLAELQDMTDAFKKLQQRNKLLPKSQIISQEEFFLDERISDDLKFILQAEKDLVYRKLAFKLEKSELRLEKLMNHYINKLDLYPFSVTGLYDKVNVQVIRQRKLGILFNEMKKLVIKKIEEANEKQSLESSCEDTRSITSASAFEDVVSSVKEKLSRVESFLVGLSPSTIEHRLSPRIRRLLNRYRLKRKLMENRQKEWDDLVSTKPLEGVNHPDDIAALKQAENSIGDYKLKSADNYKVPKDQRETTLKKYQQLLDTRERMFVIRYNFNLKLYELRKAKVEIMEKIEKLKNNLRKVDIEIFNACSKKLSEENDEGMLYVEFPENNLNVVVEPIQDPNKLDDQNIDNLNLNLSLFELPVTDISFVDQLTIDDVLQNIEQSEIEVVPFESLDYLKQLIESRQETPWELSIKKARVLRTLFQQAEMKKEIQKLIDDFNNDIITLKLERIKSNLEATYLDHHLLTLHQELIILREYESVENNLSDKMYTRMLENQEVQSKVIALKSKIETKKKETEYFREKIKEITQRFNTMVQDNKFQSFLKRIFRKKYKPVKIITEDASSSESSSSDSSDSDDDNDSETVDSHDIGAFRMDENICPKGCDQTIYDTTFTLRSQRHKFEQDEKEAIKSIDLFQIELDIMSKKGKVCEAAFKKAHEELEIVQQEKQRKLNKVECLVVLNMGQIQNIESNNEMASLKNSLIFTMPNLQRLYKRVGEIKQETLTQKAKHKVNRVHLQRMKNDCNFMRKRIFEIKRDILEAMYTKFGRELNVDEMESSILRKLVHELRITIIDIRGVYEKELEQWREENRQLQVELTNAIRENTERLTLFVVLEEEKNFLSTLLQHQEKMKCQVDDSMEKSYIEDLNKLIRINKTQQLQIQALKDEIRILSSKSAVPHSNTGLKYAMKKATDDIPYFDSKNKLFEQNIIDVYQAWFESEELNEAMPKDVPKQIFYDLLMFIYEEETDSNKACEIAKICISEIISASEQLQKVLPNMDIIDNVIKSITSKFDLSMDAYNSRESLRDVIEDIIHELSKLDEHKSKEQDKNNEDDQEIENATFEVIDELIVNAIEQLPKPLTSSSLEYYIERIIIYLLEQLPLDVVQQNRTISILVDKLNTYITLEPNAPLPTIKSEEMIKNIVLQIGLAIHVNHSEIRNIVDLVMKKFLTGELLP